MRKVKRVSRRNLKNAAKAKDLFQLDTSDVRAMLAFLKRRNHSCAHNRGPNSY